MKPSTASDLRPLAVILARGGSKRLPGKNIRMFNRRPLIAGTIRRISATRKFSRVLVSTDCPEIARIAQQAGAWVPFQRPAHLASDEASSLDALLHAVKTARELAPALSPAFIGLFQPTSPFLSEAHIVVAVELFEREGVSTMSSMCPVTEHPEWMFRATKAGNAQPLHPKDFFRPAGELQKLLRENGALYLVKTEFLQQNASLYNLKNHGAFLMSTEDSVDIDTQQDWDFAEFLLKNRYRRSKR